MIRTLLSRFCYFFISLTLLLAPIPVSAIVQDVYVSDIETELIMYQSDMSYIYLGKELSNITQLISELSILDYDKNSSLSQLYHHISQGFFVAHYDDVAAALTHAELILQKHYHLLNDTKAKQLFDDFE